MRSTNLCQGSVQQVCLLIKYKSFDNAIEFWTKEKPLKKSFSKKSSDISPAQTPITYQQRRFDKLFLTRRLRVIHIKFDKCVLSSVVWEHDFSTAVELSVCLNYRLNSIPLNLRQSPVAERLGKVNCFEKQKQNFLEADNAYQGIIRSGPLFIINEQ